MRRWILIGLSFVGSAVLLWLVLRDVPFQEVISGIQQANPFWLFVNFIAVTLGLGFRGVRWWGLLERRLSVKEAFLLQGVTFMLNQLPLRAGEIARSAIVTRHQIPFVTSVTSILVERILDMLLVVVMIAVALTQLPDAPPEVGQGAFVFGTLALVGFVGMIGLAKFPNLAHSLIDSVLKTIPFLEKLPIRTLFTQILGGLSPLTHLKGFMHVVGWTAISWTASFASLWALVNALNVQGVNVFVVVVMGVCLTALGLALPLSVASLGPFQAAMVVLAPLVGMENSQAVTLGFLANGMAILGYVVWGTIGMFVMGLSLGEMFTQHPQNKQNPAH